MGRQGRAKRARGTVQRASADGQLSTRPRPGNAESGGSDVVPGPESPVRRLNDVFVVGRLPRVTYNPRSSLRLEEQLREYLEDRGTILSVSGPTKTGKTTLLKNVAPDAIWLSGGAVSSIEDMWQQIADVLQLPTEHSNESAREDKEERATEVGVSIKAVSGKHTAASGNTTSSTTGATRERDMSAAARSAVRNSEQVIVIDDFHYVDPAVQLGIVRSLKDLVFDGLGVIFASVPHRAYDAVRVEKEMTGRVTHLNISQWGDSELAEIAQTGFAALNVIDRSDLSARLARESFGSPHLMQEFCKRLCRQNEVHETRPHGQVLQSPGDWTSFFQIAAADTSKTAFDMLAQGPRQRTDRIVRTLRDNRQVDIYVAILAAIAHTGPALSIGYESLRAALREVLTSDLPQRHEVTRVLDQMTLIAKERIEGEPVVEYDEEFSTLHISDPYFAFYLRWGRGRLETSQG